MSGGVLFLRTRRWPVVAIVVAVSFVLVVSCGPLVYAINPSGGYRIAVAAQVPLLAAIVIPASLASPLGRLERQSARPLVLWRAAHLAGWCFVCCLLLAIAISAIRPPSGVLLNGYSLIGPVAMSRNLLGFTGAALIGIALTGPALGWILPLSWAILPSLLLPEPGADPTGLFAFAAQPDDAFASFCLAVALWIVGFGLAVTNRGRWRTAQGAG